MRLRVRGDHVEHVVRFVMSFDVALEVIRVRPIEQGPDVRGSPARDEFEQTATRRLQTAGVREGGAECRRRAISQGHGLIIRRADQPSETIHEGRVVGRANTHGVARQVGHGTALDADLMVTDLFLGTGPAETYVHEVPARERLLEIGAHAAFAE